MAIHRGSSHKPTAKKKPVKKKKKKKKKFGSFFPPIK